MWQAPAVPAGDPASTGRGRIVRHRLAVLVLAAVLAGAACGGEPPSPEPLPPWHEADGHRWRELRVSGSETGFTPLTEEQTGLDIPFRVPEESLLENELLADGSGVAVGDVDGDGWPDLYVTRVHGANGLFLNAGGMRFVEATDSYGVALADHRSTAAVLEDLDGDGDRDLLVGGLGDRNRLLLNDGEGRFTDATDGSGLTGREGTRALTLADVDRDGDLDLYVGNYKRRKAVDVFSPEERRDEAVFRRQGDSLVIAPKYRDHYTILRSGGGIQRWELAEPDRFYLNRGDGHFREVSFTGGRFLTASGEPLASTPRDWALSARFHDLDGDGDQDIYVCNDFRRPDHVWMNRGDGSFRLVEPLKLRTTSASCMAVDFTDLDGDGGIEIFTSDMRFPHGPGRRQRVRGVYPERPLPSEMSTVVQENFNALQWRRADGTWSEVARHGGVAATGWTWGVAFEDADLDGREDLFLAAGNVWDFLDPDAQRRIAGEGSGPVPSEERLAGLDRLPLENAAFRAAGGELRFEDRAAEWSFGTGEDISHAVVPADLDRDGDRDLVVTGWGRSPVIFRNEADRPRVAVRVRGRPPNTSAVGAEVRLTGGPVALQWRQVEAGGPYISDAGRAMSFAAGGASALTLEIRWPDGGCTRLPVSPGRVYEVSEPRRSTATERRDCPSRDPSEGEGGDAGSGAGATHGVSPDADVRGRLFRDVTSSLGHRHADRPFEDFRRQPLVPYRLSELGPGISWQDVDGDGDADLLVPAGRGGRLALYRNDGGRLRAVDSGGASWAEPADQDQTTVLAMPAPARAARDLLVGVMAYETEASSTVADVPAVRRHGLGPGLAGAGSRIVAGGARSVPGPLALADVDGDGDLDLFVGHRVFPAAYPIPPSSRLYRNEGGELVLDRGWSSAFQGMGMVTSALFVDLERDGDPDLVAATEWGPIRVYRNRGDGFREVTASMGLEGLTGRWNGVAAGDLDGDGRQDLVVTGWGTNTEYGRVTPETAPLLVYFGLFDENSSLDVMLARNDTTVGGPAPLRGWQWLGPALPGVAEDVASYRDFARSTVEELLELPRENISRAEAVDLRHLVLMNTGEGFDARPLPMEAQIAPAFGVTVADLDGDGREDVALAQNFSGVPPGDGPYRSGRSLWLRGDGEGGFIPLPDSVSGLWTYGDGRGLAVADYDGDARADLAVAQHGAATRLFRNVGAEPGLRVRLRGPPGNPDAVGATVRVVYGDGGMGPAREIRAGSGHRSGDSPVPVLGLAGDPRAVRIRWPGGETTEVPVAAGARRVTARMPGPGR